MRARYNNLAISAIPSSYTTHNLCFILIVSFTLSSAKPFTYSFIVLLVFLEPKWIWAGEIDNKIREKLSGVSILKNCHQVNRISIDEDRL